MLNLMLFIGLYLEVGGKDLTSPSVRRWIIYESPRETTEVAEASSRSLGMCFSDKKYMQLSSCEYPLIVSTSPI